MQTEYEGIQISYIEDTDNWHFELRGRSRTADSLAKAKAAIDKEPKERRVEFQRFDCYLFKYGDTKTVTVTSVAESDYSGKLSFWVTNTAGNKERSKERADCLFPVTDYNTVLIGQIKEKEADVDSIEKAIVALKKRLTIAAIPEDVK